MVASCGNGGYENDLGLASAEIQGVVIRRERSLRPTCSGTVRRRGAGCAAPPVPSPARSQPADTHPRMSARVGDQADALDSGDGAGFVVLRAVSADPDGTEQGAL